jgi:acetyl esterase/lipase
VIRAVRPGPLLCALVMACTAPPPDTTAFGGAATVHRNLVYGTESARQRLDVFVPRDRSSPPPLVVWVHGGAWMSGTKEAGELEVAPFVAAGWAVANVEYRLSGEATAPAAAADVRCAVKWIARRAHGYGVDASHLVLAGHSAGAHLALLAAFADTTAGLDVACPGDLPAMQGVIDWSGITDVEDLRRGPSARGWADDWIGAFPGAAERARRMSPLAWVRPGLPAVLIIHGDSDRLVPVAHAERLHASLQRAGVSSELVVLRGAGHGPLSERDAATSWAGIMRWLVATRGAGPH